jgi:hypothetical protein
VSRIQLIQFRRDVAAVWTAKNPVLADGELGFERDTGKFKVGDGTSAWADLNYFETSVGGVAGVATFNTRSGAVVLLAADVTAALGLTDPGADRILFWDDSANSYAHLVLGTNLSITGTTLNASGGGSADDTAYGAGWNGSLLAPTQNTVYDKFVSMDAAKANLSGATFSGDILVPDEAYDATAWNGNFEAPTKNAVRDKIETLQPLHANLTQIAALVDPNADRLLFWDDSAGAYTHLTLGTNLSITGTTLDAAGGGGGVSDGDKGDVVVASGGTVWTVPDLGLKANLTGGNTFAGNQTFSDNVLFGGLGSVSVATPNWISVGGKYANARGGPPKIRLHDDGVTAVGFGYSYDGVTGGFDYMALAANDHSFYIAGTRYLRVDATGLLVNGDVTVIDEAYDATSWNGSLKAPTRNAVRDKIETLQPLHANLTQLAALADPNADRLLFWDDSAGAYTHLTLGTNLSITGTTLDAAGGGGGSPGGSDRQIQFNNAGAFAGAAGLDIDADGNLRVDHAASVTTPGVDQLTFVPQRLNASGGRVMPRWRSEDAVSMSMATHQGRNTVTWGQAIGGNATTAIAPVGSAAMTALGTATGRAYATTNRLTRARRLAYVSAGTAGATAGLYINAAALCPYTVGGVSGGGFKFVWRGAVSDVSLVAGAHCMIGLRNNTTSPVAGTNPNTYVNIIALAQLNGGANWHIIYGGSAAQTPVDTGIAINNTHLLEFILYARPDVNNKVTWRLENISTGAIASGELTGTAGTALPANTTFLGPLMWRSNNATASAVGIDIVSYYIESDFA